MYDEESDSNLNSLAQNQLYVLLIIGAYPLATE